MKSHQLKYWLLLIVICHTLGIVMAQTKMKIENLNGPVLQSEINSFKNYMSSLDNPKPDNTNNNFVYGDCGSNTEALGKMYQISGDIEILNLMIKYADHMLHARNNPQTGRIIWTGNRELCWPNKNPTDLTADSVYSGTENGDIIAHIAFCSKLIIQNKLIWDKKIPFGDPFQFGQSYIERARTYIFECNKTIDSFILPHFVKKETCDLIFPVSPKYGFDERSIKAIGKPVPWNQQSMLSGGFMRLAECMELLKSEPERVKVYDKIVEVYVTSFLKSMVIYRMKNVNCCKWSYHVEDPTLKYVEDLSHSDYDMLGLFRAFQRNKYNVTKENIQLFANTLQYVIYKEDKTFAGKVDGSDGKRARGYVNNGWVLLPVICPEIYEIVANAGLRPAESRPNLMASILWMKDQRFKSIKNK